jgi:hypothetical protein
MDLVICPSSRLSYNSEVLICRDYCATIDLYRYQIQMYVIFDFKGVQVRDQFSTMKM